MTRSLLAALLLAALLAPAPARAGALFDGYWENGGFAAPIVKVGHIKGESEVILGARAAWLVDHVVGLGGGYYLLTSDVPLKNAEGEDRVLKMGYGGLEVEYVLWPRSVVHLSLAGHLGVGSVKLRDPVAGSDADPDGDSIFLGEPTLSVVVNVTDFARLYLGGGYRFVTGVDLTVLSNGDLQAWFGQVGLTFGAF